MGNISPRQREKKKSLSFYAFAILRGAAWRGAAWRGAAGGRWSLIVESQFSCYEFFTSPVFFPLNERRVYKMGKAAAAAAAPGWRRTPSLRTKTLCQPLKIPLADSSSCGGERA